MLLRTLLAVLLLGTVPAFAQPVLVPDCTVDVALHEALTLDVAYHCRSSQPLSFVPEGERAQPFLSNFTAGRIEAMNGLVEAHHRFDLRRYSPAINTTAESIPPRQ